MIRKIIGLGALLAFLGPVSCLSDDGPKPFTTSDSCAAGDVEGCTCEKPARLGAHGCAADGTFSHSKCRCAAGCTLLPDCGKCGDGCERCICERMGRVDECAAACATPAADSGS